MQPADLIKKEIRRQLTVAGKAEATINYVCDEMGDRFKQGAFIKPSDLIVDGVKLGKKLEK